MKMTLLAGILGIQDRWRDEIPHENIHIFCTLKG